MRIVLQESPTPMPTDYEQRETRRREILALLGAARVTNQIELVELLHGRGIAATQSSVSRDLRDLGVAWIGGRYALPPQEEDAAADGSGLGELARLLRAARPAGPHLTVLT